MKLLNIFRKVSQVVFDQFHWEISSFVNFQVNKLNLDYKYLFLDVDLPTYWQDGMKVPG